MSLGGILKTVAPTLASMLPGPLGAMAKEAVTSLLGIKADATEAEIEKSLATANPDILLKLKQLDADYKTKMKQLDVDLERMTYEDTANARAREIATKDWTPRILAGLIIGGFLTFNFLVLKSNLNLANQAIITGNIEIMKMSVILVLGYYFGSSAGSRAKDKTLDRMSK